MNNKLAEFYIFVAVELSLCAYCIVDDTIICLVNSFPGNMADEFTKLI